MNDSVPELTLRAVVNMAVDLNAGVTTSRCCGDKEFLDIACKQAVDSGRFQGPRLLVAGRGIRATHGHGFVGYPFDGLESVRLAVRENLKAGADLIKVYVTGTLKGSGNIPAYLSKSEISLAVQEAKRLQAKTAAHCIGGIGMDWALELGIDSIEHGYFMTEEQIDRMAQSKSWLVITPSPFFAEERIRKLPSPLMDEFRRERDEVADRMAAAIKGGVKIAVGTDGMHGGLARELEYLTEFGASFSDALTAATRNGARVCGLEAHVGTLEPGKSADILGVQGDPLKDIRALRRIETVFFRGKAMRSSC
jgi:imidazolonepropionase-like amidohydrolase